MRAALGIDALIRQTKPFNWPSTDEVFSHDLLSVFRLHVAIPDSFWIDHHGGTVFALVQTARLVDADLACQTGGFGEHLQLRNQFTLAILGARRPGSAFRADILTDKYVTFKGCQTGISSRVHRTG
jgi:hypothetical protein